MREYFNPPVPRRATEKQPKVVVGGVRLTLFSSHCPDIRDTRSELKFIIRYSRISRECIIIITILQRF